MLLCGKSVLHRISSCSHALHRRLFSGQSSLPSQAQCIVIGGGVIGNSVAYHLTKMGMKDVLLLEQSSLTSGTTWHAAGLMVTFGSLSETSTEIRKYTKELYSSVLEAETGQSTGFKPVGFIELASTKDRLEEYRRISAFNRRFGVEVQELSPREVQDKFPLCRVDDILAGFYVADDGRVNPVDATIAFSKGAKLHGAKLYENVRVERILTQLSSNQNDSIITGVQLEGGHVIKSEFVVNCAGMWARQLAQHHSTPAVILPNQAAEHYYLVTDSMSEVDPMWPVIEDPQHYTYIRPEGDGLMIGLFEGQGAAWHPESIPPSFSFGEIEPDWERMAPYVEAAMGRVPATLKYGVKKFFCGPESFTPDLAPAFGETPEIQNYFVAAGLNSIGILTGGGIGRSLAHWIINGQPDVDVSGIHVDRFQGYMMNKSFRESRVQESLGLVYKCHYPYKTKLSGRGVKFTPFYTALKDQGAYFRDVSGWECADWFYPEDQKGDMTSIDLQEKIARLGKNETFGRPDWFEFWATEHNACRNGVMLLDMSFMSKFFVNGKDAGSTLNFLSTADVNGDSGRITYTQWLNHKGTLEADVTVTKLSDDEFLVIATDTMHRHVQTWLHRNLSPDGSKDVKVTDVTGSFAQLNIQGPYSREFMNVLCNYSKCNDSPFSNEKFAFRDVKSVEIGYVTVYCARITYLGELGYELYIPSEQALHVYRKVMETKHHLEELDVKYPVRLGGLKALASLRLEKGYRDYGHDMDNTDTLMEMGLGFTADMKKEGGFIGKEMVMKQKAELREYKGLKKRLVHVLVSKDDLGPDANKVMMYHGEILFRDGQCVGDIRAGSYGHTLGGLVGLGHVVAEDPNVRVGKEYLMSGKWELEIAGKRYRAQLSFTPFYDPKNLKIKG